jgi:hypothetical protein
MPRAVVQAVQEVVARARAVGPMPLAVVQAMRAVVAHLPDPVYTPE